MSNLKTKKKYEKFLKSVLTEQQIKDLNKALDANKVILISGIEGPTGKTTLKNILVSEGYNAVEKYETFEIELNKIRKGE